ncbi:MAG: serine hydrolase [Acidobacteria bacterium]|nr:serine hydrolase [Acidobacteriota bacterium]
MSHPKRQLKRVVTAGVVCLVAVAAGDFCVARVQAQGAARGRASAKYSAATSQARKARLAQAEAAARAREAQANQPRLKLDAQGDVVPDVRAEAAIIYNPATNKVLWEEKAFDQRSIASITKVMTALCFLEEAPDMAQQVIITAADIRGASVTHLRPLEKVSLQNLLHLMLISSDNVAARVIARVSPYGAAGFVVRMNQKAAELGLTSTSYADPSGLLAQNVSSAYDMARLIAYAADDSLISTIMRTEAYSFRTSRRALTIHSTNQLLRSTGVDVRGGKTGFIARAGYCLVTLLHLPDLDQTVAVVVLGARSNAGRFSETKNLLSWVTSKAQSLLGGRPGQPHGPASQTQH